MFKYLTINQIFNNDNFVTYRYLDKETFEERNINEKRVLSELLKIYVLGSLQIFYSLKVKVVLK